MDIKLPRKAREQASREHASDDGGLSAVSRKWFYPARSISRAEELFGRHIDLTPLHGRHCGNVRCCFHEDRTPSLSIDLDRGLFHCFGCGVQGGLLTFAALVGEAGGPRPAPPSRESPLQEARRQIGRLARTQAARAAEWAPWYFANDFVRRCAQVASQARAIATHLGPEHPRSWTMLELATRVECGGLTAEAELDEILVSGRIA